MEEKILEKIAFEVGDEVLSKNFRLGRKSSEIDLEAENSVIEKLFEFKDQLPYIFVFEEREKRNMERLVWGDKGIVYWDSLDGSTNFDFGRYDFGIGFGIFVRGYPVRFGYYKPYFKENFKAIRRKGSFVNDSLIKTPNLDLNNTHVSLLTWEDQPTAVTRSGTWHQKLLEKTGKTPTTTYTESGDLINAGIGGFSAAVINYEEIPGWDAIAALFVEEAGGYASNIYSEPWYIFRNSLIASGSKILHKELLQLLR